MINKRVYGVSNEQLKKYKFNKIVEFDFFKILILGNKL